jgi:hypothetical protein
MEAALLPPFLDSTILFLSTSNFEKTLRQELWLCHKHMDLSMEDLYNMSVTDRKSYIIIHNRQVEQEKQRLEGFRKNK